MRKCLGTENPIRKFSHARSSSAPRHDKLHNTSRPLSSFKTASRVFHDLEMVKECAVRPYRRAISTTTGLFAILQPSLLNILASATRGESSNASLPSLEQPKASIDICPSHRETEYFGKRSPSLIRRSAFSFVSFSSCYLGSLPFHFEHKLSVKRILTISTALVPKNVFLFVL